MHPRHSESFPGQPCVLRGRWPVLGVGGGRPQRQSSKISDLKSADTSTEAFPLRPFGPPPPYDGGGKSLGASLRPPLRVPRLVPGRISARCVVRLKPRG